MKTQYITDEKGKKTGVILPMDTYEKMLEQLEEFEAIKVYDEAQKRELKFAKAEDVFKSIEGKRKK